MPPLRSTLGFDDYVEYEDLSQIEKSFLEWYRLNAADYDQYLPITFEILGCDEMIERKKLYKALDINTGQTVLEIGAGTGRDSIEISKTLGTNGILVAQDISPEILSICREKYKESFEENFQIDFILSNAKKLPFPDGTFDRVFHFGGLNTFGDISSALLEINRVTKNGGKVLIGDEGIAPWLRSSRFGAMLQATNSQYLNQPPLSEIPESSSDVTLQWFCSGAFYYIVYDVNKDSLNTSNFDAEIPGIRGGTPRKRLDGVLEGISPELKLEIYARAKSMGFSRVEFIEQALKQYIDKTI
jgi:SAM-dependent methyltransferase